MSGCHVGHVVDDNFLKYILRFPSYEDYGIHKKTEYETDLEAESLDVEEVSNMTSNSSLEKFGKKSYKDIIWQWDDAAWIMCAVLMTFTMQVVFFGVQGDDLKVILIIFTILIIQTGFAILEGGCTTLKNEVSSLFTKMKLMAIMSMMSFLFR